jgi:hypothetical protein
MTRTTDAIWEATRSYAKSCVADPSKSLFDLFALELLSNPSKFDDLFGQLADDTSKRVLEWAIKWRMAAFFVQSRETASVMFPPRISGAKHEAMLAATKL